jgi:hypothetical protein
MPFNITSNKSQRNQNNLNVPISPLTNFMLAIKDINIPQHRRFANGNFAKRNGWSRSSSSILTVRSSPSSTSTHLLGITIVDGWRWRGTFRRRWWTGPGRRRRCPTRWWRIRINFFGWPWCGRWRRWLRHRRCCGGRH